LFYNLPLKGTCLVTCQRTSHNYVKCDEVWRTTNFLLVVTHAVMDKFLSGYERKSRSNEADLSKYNEASSNTGTVCEKPK